MDGYCWKGIVCDPSSGQLSVVRLESKNLSGPIPNELSTIQSIKFFFLGENALEGATPLGINNITNLEALHLNDNKLTGRLEKEVGRLGKLRSLLLQNKNLEGRIYRELKDLTSTSIVKLYNNNLVSSFPMRMCRLIKPENRNLHMLLADCSGDEPKVECECCTECYPLSDEVIQTTLAAADTFESPVDDTKDLQQDND